MHHPLHPSGEAVPDGTAGQCVISSRAKRDSYRPPRVKKTANAELQAQTSKASGLWRGNLQYLHAIGYCVLLNSKFDPNPQQTIAEWPRLRDGVQLMRKMRRFLSATMPDGYVKTIGPTADNFTHYWRIVAELPNGKTEVFWGHTRSLSDARKKRTAAQDAARMRGWTRFKFEIVELVEVPIEEP